MDCGGIYDDMSLGTCSCYWNRAVNFSHGMYCVQHDNFSPQFLFAGYRCSCAADLHTATQATTATQAVSC